MGKYKSTDKKKCEKSDIFQQGIRVHSWPASFRHIWETPECCQAQKSWAVLSVHPTKSHKGFRGTELHFNRIWGILYFLFSIKKGPVCCHKTFYWSQPLTSSKGLRNLLSGCSGSVLWKAGDNLMSKWVNISFEYPSYAGLHKRQWKLKTQQLPLRNFCKSEETT